MIHDNIILTAGSVGVEFFGKPTRLFESLLVAFFFAIGCLWACWRVGRLFNRSYRPGLGNLMLALIAASSVFAAVVGLTAVSYTRSMISSAFEAGQAGAQTLSSQAPEACRAMRAALPYLDRQTGQNLTLNCDSPSALNQLWAELGPKVEEIHAGVQDRFLWNECIIVAGALFSLGICLFITSWRASRSLVLHVGGYRHS